MLTKIKELSTSNFYGNEEAWETAVNEFLDELARDPNVTNIEIQYQMSISDSMIEKGVLVIYTIDKV